MYGIEFEHVAKWFGETMIINDLELCINKGERLVLLGPSGCGKTTILRMIAGLESITKGVLRMGGEIKNKVEPGDRNVAMVFQNYALYPHMTVWENVTFGLAIQKIPQEEIKRRAEAALGIVDLLGYENRKPHELSGGQKQRVAFGRALVKQAPYFLLDEPLSNLDSQLRLQARTELVKIHELYNPTLVYVTHDQVEAMTVGQRIGIMNKGVLQQIGAPEAIYDQPANIFVASFIGAPPMNLLQGHFSEGGLWIDGSKIVLPGSWQGIIRQQAPIILGIRPEHCKISDSPVLHGQVERVEHLGANRCVHIRLGDGQKVLSIIPTGTPVPAGNVGIAFPWNRINLFNGPNGDNIGRPEGAEFILAS